MAATPEGLAPGAQGGTLMKAKVTILEVIDRPSYELISVAGPDRPIYVGSQKWRERQAANPKENNQ